MAWTQPTLDPADGRWPADRSGFLADLRAKADLLEAGHAAGQAAGDPALHPAGLLFAGMGFSGVSSELVKDACTRVMDTPFTIVKHYQFPRHVQRDWHLLAVSYSGETEETLAIAQEAQRRGVPTTTFATGGSLAAFGRRNVPQPPGHQPRAVLAHAWASLLGFLEASHLLQEKVPMPEMVQAVADADAACGPEVPEERNPAKRLARLLVEKIPQIYATPAFYGVAHHFRGMLNENAKKIANFELIPDCNHNDLSGWGGDEENRRHFVVLFLSHEAQNPEIQKRIRYMRERCTAWEVPWHHEVFRPIDSFREHCIEQARAIQMLDYASFYAAMLREKDPSEIKEIKRLKAYLRPA